MSKVYIITSGEYSGYGINGVTLDKGEAEEYAKLHDEDVEEWELGVDTNVDGRPLHTYWYLVHMNRDGEVLLIERNDVDDRKSDKPWSPSTRVKEFVRFAMWAKDEEHATKIANERRAILLAGNIWTTDREVFRKLQAGQIDDEVVAALRGNHETQAAS